MNYAAAGAKQVVDATRPEGPPLIDEVNTILREALEIIDGGKADVSRFADDTIGPVPTPINSGLVPGGRPLNEGPRGSQLGALARSVREAAYEIRNQINRLSAI